MHLHLANALSLSWLNHIKNEDNWKLVILSSCRRIHQSRMQQMQWLLQESKRNERHHILQSKFHTFRWLQQRASAKNLFCQAHNDLCHIRSNRWKCLWKKKWCWPTIQLGLYKLVLCLSYETIISNVSLDGNYISFRLFSRQSHWTQLQAFRFSISKLLLMKCNTAPNLISSTAKSSPPSNLNLNVSSNSFYARIIKS